MAYISKETKAKLAPGIKAVLKKYGMKGTIATPRNTSLTINLREGDLDIIGNMINTRNMNPTAYDRIDEAPTYLQVHQYHIDQNYSGEVAEFLTELFAAMRGDVWYDNSDIQTDYFDTAYYLNVNVGKWDKPYVCTI